ncbi:MAG TPA: CDP-alcohol phosphatidyltransferase family protein [Acidimicrobiales bacterium]|nr:CDP-alcohol phosphatidyltransferase family protein [Acidimicrobiales bacterium]
MFDGRFRTGVDKVTKPVARVLRATGLAPDHLTALGLILAVPAAWAIASGRLGLGLGLLIGSAVPDLLDGALAKASGRGSVRGAFFDSVADRVTDALMLSAVAWYLSDSHKGHIFMLPVAVLGVSLLVSYERAKAESLGYTAKGGLMERAERIVVLCASLAFSFMMIPLLWLMLALTGATAVQRFVKVWRQANAAGQRPAPAERRVFVRRPGYEPSPMSVRWRAWREANGWVSRPERYGERARPGSASARWQERRQARLARLGRLEGDHDRAEVAPRRRPGTRRP